MNVSSLLVPNNAMNFGCSLKRRSQKSLWLLTIPCEELADGGPLRLARGFENAATQKGLCLRAEGEAKRNVRKRRSALRPVAFLLGQESAQRKPGETTAHPAPLRIRAL